MRADDAIKRLYEADKASAPKPEALPFFTFQEAEVADEPAELVEALLGLGEMAILYGGSGSGKTFLILDIAVCVAAGQPWRDRTVEQGGVVIFAMEGGERAARKRIAAIKRERGWGGYDLPLAVVARGIDLRSPKADTDAVIETIRAVEKRFGIPVRLVVFDTLSRALAGGNDSAAEDAGSLIQNSDRIRRETGAHVCWVHHTGKDETKGARGWSGLRAATDTEIEVVANGNQRIARVTKQRDMETTGEFAFSLDMVDLGLTSRGKPVASCVVRHDAGTLASPTKLTGDKARAFEILADLIAGSGESGHHAVPHGLRSVPDERWRQSFYDRAKPGADQDAKQKAFRRAADGLVESHLVGMGGNRVWLVARDAAP